MILINFEIIKKNNEFQRIFEKGHSIFSRYLVVYFLPNELTELRFGFCVGKKLGSAVVRNHLKRIMREAIRQIKLDFEDNMDIIFIARNSMLKANLSNVMTDLEIIMPKLKKQFKK